MNARTEQKRPIIIKRIAAHEDEHNGQWKVAYADFVTAMMAFFLIMWLLSATTSNDRQVIAKYFSSTSLFDLPAGNGVLNGGPSVLDGADSKSARRAPILKETKEKLAQTQNTKPTDAPSQIRDNSEHQRVEAVKAELEQMMASGELKSMSSNIEVTMTSEGLHIQIFDRDGEPMFSPGGTDPLPRLKTILGVIAQVLGTVQNSVILSGHTDSQALHRNNYSNWELSADRANAVRRTLEADGLAPNRVIKVEGRGSTEPLLPESPLDPRNRRISVTILRNDTDQPPH